MYSESQETQSVDVRAGDIMKAKPKYFEPRPTGTGGIGQHPVILLTNPDNNGYVQVATMSHSHPNNPPTRLASSFGLPIDPLKGESTVSVGVPQKIHINFLRPHTPHTRMCPARFMELRSEITRNCAHVAGNIFCDQ